jgi:hypothetical protein
LEVLKIEKSELEVLKIEESELLYIDSRALGDSNREDMAQMNGTLQRTSSSPINTISECFATKCQ